MKGAGGATYEHRQLANSVRKLALSEIEKVLSPKFKDKSYQRAMLLKIAPALLPRLNEHTGEDGGPIQIQGVEITVRK